MSKYSAPINPAMAMQPPMAWRRTTANARVPGIAQWTFIAFFLFTLLNCVPLLQHSLKTQGLPIQPVAFVLTAMIVIPFARAKPSSSYFVVAWILWILFSIGGFLGPDRLASFADKGLYQLIIKLWISLIGLPMFMLRAISRDKIPLLVRLAVLGVASGGLFSVAQIVFRARLGAFSAEIGRGAGYWVDPNSCSHALSFFLFYSYLFPFRTKAVNLAIRGIMILGILATLSRTGLVLLPIGFLTYAIAAKRVRILLQAGIALAVVAIAANILVNLLQPKSGAGSSLEGYKSTLRLTRFSNMLQGKMAADEKSTSLDRLIFWNYGWQAIMREPILGRGHRFMDSVVPIGDGLGPHNYYLFIWGNSGLFAFLAFLTFLFTLVRMSRQCTDPTAKPVMLAITAMLISIAFVDHALMNVQFLGCVLAIMVSLHYYNRPQKRSFQQLPQVPNVVPRPRGA
ncbi:MAG TPA: O-antigen ligase family protein [Pirellulales bacterium]|jgi:hypothetical protein